jgi:hypothetical protein
MNPKYPVFVPTKGRFESLLTIKMLERLKVPYRAVVEPQELENYSKVIDRKKLLITPHSNKGLVVTRNWIWDFAESQGYKKFWTIDDNISDIYRLVNNLKVRVTSGTAFAVIEDFADRYMNTPVVGMAYAMFCPRKRKIPPLIINTRVYSNMLIDTFAKDKKGRPFRNEGFYNDDTDLCLRILKDGQCTIQVQSFLIDKKQTMSIKGGMTEHYLGDGRLKMAQELQRKHPDVTTIKKKFNKWQHQVDYSSFRNNKLIYADNYQKVTGINNYGLKVIIKDLDGTPQA